MSTGPNKDRPDRRARRPRTKTFCETLGACAETSTQYAQDLDLSFNRISGAGVAAIAASLGDPRCRVRRLSLSQNGFGRRGGEHLGRMLTGGAGGGEGGQWGQVRKGWGKVRK